MNVIPAEAGTRKDTAMASHLHGNDGRAGNENG